MVGPVAWWRALRARRKRDRRARGVAPTFAVLGFMLAVTGSAPVGAAPSSAPRLVPLNASEEGRQRVRGGRPDGASIHVAWAPGVDDPDAEQREALAAFERASFPKGATLTKSIIDAPPEAWMRRLAKPDLPVRWNNKTVEYLRYFKDDPKGQRMMRAWMRRAGRYETRLRAILGQVGVPRDLVYVALAESGFNPRVRSRVGAAGLWQFMEGTGEVYGLRRDYWVDERFDIERSTHAAALYLRDLRVRFGSWELALAAYNAGYGLVMTSIERHNTNNFWALCTIESGLPYATTNYVPKIVAAALVGKNRARFSVTPTEVDALPAVDWVEVRVPQSTSLAKLAAAIDSEADLIEELNAHLVRGRTPPRRGRYPVRIPRDKVDAFERAQSKLRAQWKAETTYTIRHGETLAEVAHLHGISERDLRRINGVQDPAEVVGDVVLVVPASPPTRAETETAAEPAPEPPIAAVPPLSPGAGRKIVFFQTTRATTPRTLEHAFGVRYSEIVAWNDLDPHARLQAEQVLQIVVDGDFDPDRHGVRIYGPDEVELVLRGSSPHLDAALKRRGMVRRGYVVKRGDTLRKIGRRFDLSVGSLARINAFERDHEPVPGDMLVVYVPSKRRRGTVDPPPPTGFVTGPVPVVSAPIRRPSTPTTARLPGGGPKTTPRRAPSTASTSRLPGRAP